jgi:hypothetical protein
MISDDEYEISSLRNNIIDAFHILGLGSFYKKFFFPSILLVIKQHYFCGLLFHMFMFRVAFI